MKVQGRGEACRRGYLSVSGLLAEEMLALAHD